MKNIRKIIFSVIFAVMLALGAFSLVACDSNEDTRTKADYTLTFMNGTVLYDAVTAQEGSEYKSKMKGDPYRVNYVFDGWSLTANGEVVELPATMPSENRTYYAVFSSWFNLKLNAGIGTIPADKTTMSVKEGENIYDLISSVSPTVEDGDATFVGWFLRGSDLITSTSGQKMPSSNVEVVAKYEVGYKLNIYKETEFDTGVYGDTADEIKTGKAYVGDKVTEIPQYTGYHYDVDKTNEVLYSNLGKTLAQNTFSLYYKISGHDVVFNVNLPAGVEYSGEMDTMTCGHGQTNAIPDCDFVADGYRFLGWSTTADGDVEYYVNDDFSIDRTITLYAKWIRGLTELAGFSSDRVYLIENRSTNTIVPYLERTGLENDLVGEYDASKCIFTFKNTTAQNADKVLLRGIANVETETFTYLNINGSTVYRLQTLDGEIDNTVTLSLADDGKAVYNNGGDTLNGNYAMGSEGSLVFAGTTEFAFRLVYDAEAGFTNFMIRGKEYGEWNNISQASVVDLAYTLDFDGYGHATMYVSGLNSSLQTVTTEFSGIYRYSTGNGAYVGDDGTEVVVTLFNNSLEAQQFACLLMTGEYHTLSANDTNVYTNVYLQRFETTLYGVPVGDSELDTATADKIVLSGYSVVSESATYTYKNGSETVTVKGKYFYDSTAGTLRIIRADDGADLLFEVTVSDGVPLFEPVDKLFGQYEITGLDNIDAMFRFYTFHIYNNNRAALALYIPMSDSFYGNVAFEYTRLIYGEYTVAIDGKNDDGEYDERANIYEFSAEVDPFIANYVYYMYGNIFGYSLDISNFGSFRFQFVYGAETGAIVKANVYARGDYLGGRKINYNDVEYTLDGFGNAFAQVEGKEVILNYSFDTSRGINFLYLFIDPNNQNNNVMYVDAHGTGDFIEYEDGYYITNAGTLFGIFFFKNGTAMLTLMYGSSAFLPFSYGNVTWEDENHTYGKYVRDASVFSDVYNALNIEYAEFKFSRITTTVKDEDGNVVKDDNGNDKQVTRFHIYEVGNTAANSDNKYVITDADGNELTLGRNDNTATYIQKGEGENADKEYSGTYSYSGDNIVVLTYKVNGANYSITFKLEYNQAGAIASFTQIRGDAGYYISYEDAKSYIHLTGMKAGEENGVYAATYTLYNAETETYDNIEGTYKYNIDRQGYDFVYATGEKDAEGNDVTEMFTFALGKDAAGILFFRKYVMELNAPVGYLSASIGRPVQVGTLSGGGYSNQVFTLFQTQYVGSLEPNEEAGVWVFTATNGSVFYFRITTFGIMLLDNTFIIESKGMFELSKPIDVDVAATEGEEATEDTPAVDPIPAHTAHVTSIEMSGMALAYLHYNYNGEDMVISGLYVQYATNGFVFIRLNGVGETDLQFRFRLMMHRDDDGNATYVAELADMDYFGTFANDDLTLINLNGFSTAYYVDGYGRVYGGTYEVLDEETHFIHILYVDYYNYEVRHVYARLDAETHKFVIVDAPEADND